jgi:hypothetical protein
MFTTCSDCNNDFIAGQGRTVCWRCESQSNEVAEIEAREQEFVAKACHEKGGDNPGNL